MDKRLLFPKNNERERDIFFVKEDRKYLEKKASGYHPEIQKYIEKAKPMDDLIQVLLTALGAYPYWPQNVNGDRFLEKALANPTDDFGYKTFVTTGNYFTHHVNKDPALAKGKVLHSVWNDKARRVELVVGINPKLDPDAAKEIEAGNSLAFSMGAKLPFDVCSVCGNKARTRAEYCDHLKYQMNQMDPETGMLVGAINPSPKFFDISRVLIPADKTAYMWEKVASASGAISKLGSAFLADLPPGKIGDMDYLTKKAEELGQEAEVVKRAAEKKAAVRKKAAIHKQIPALAQPIFASKLTGNVASAKRALDAASPQFDIATLAKKYKLNQILMTMLVLGMVPKHDEAETLFNMFSPTEPIKPTIKDYSPELAKVLAMSLESRSFLKPALTRRLVDLSNKPEAELKKIADGMSTPKGYNPGIAAGILAALGTLMILHHSGKSPAASGIALLVKEHPLISLALGGAAIKTMREFDLGNRDTIGQVSLADPTRGFYNNDWQRRFVDMQARPVTVIKTGSDSTIQVDPETMRKHGFDGVSIMIALSGISQSPAPAFIEDNHYMFETGFLSKEAAVVIGHASDLVASARRLVKTASLDSIEFLSMVPEKDREDVWDLAILNAAGKLNKLF